VLLAPGRSGGADRPQPGKETKEDRRAGAVGSHGTSGVTDPMGDRQKTRRKTSDTHGNRQKSPNGERENTERRSGGLANRRETSRCQRKTGDVGVHIKASHRALSCRQARHRRRMAGKTSEFTLHAARGIWVVFPTPAPGRRPLKSLVFVANITNEFILELDILRAYDASVGLGRQMLRPAEEEVLLWSPGFPAW
jgi:hypothetical protein